MLPFPAARWPTFLKAVSALGVAVLAGVTYALLQAVPRGTRVPFAEEFGRGLVFLPGVVVLGTLLFVVTSYEVGPSELGIGRLLFTTRFRLAGLSRAWHDPQAMCRSIRLFGNGGLFAITGLFRNKSLGTYRAFVTDPKKAVVLRFERRTIVVSPEDPHAFLEQLASIAPGVKLGRV